MRHHNKNRTLGRDTDQRLALLRSLSVSLIERGAIITTTAKAKEVRPFVERLVTIAKTDTVAARRLVSSRMGGNDAAVATLFARIAPMFVDRAGGYTRITKIGFRDGDGAHMSQIEFVK
jgi:large subunit ribosomal protein L17